MASGARADCNDAIDAGFGGLLGMSTADDVVKDKSPIGMDGFDDIAHGTERGDDQWHLVLDSQLEIGGKARIGTMDNKVRTERRRID